MQLSVVAAFAVLGTLAFAAPNVGAVTVTSNGNLYHGYGKVTKEDGTVVQGTAYAGATAYDEKLSFSPDGKRIVFHTQVPPGATPTPVTIATANADYTNRKTIVNPATYGFQQALAPDWSPNGQKVAFVLGNYNNESGRISIINPDGTSVQHLSNTTDIATWSRTVSWYPDSNRVLYMNTSNQLCTVSISTSQKTCSVAIQGGNHGQALLSPDGKYVIVNQFSTDASGATNYDIVRMTPNATGITNLTANAPLTQANNATWSPDSKKIAFTSHGATYGLGVINVDGTGYKLVTTSGADSIGWQPVQTTVAPPSNLTVTRNQYCGNNGGVSSWLDLKATWTAQAKSSIASYKVYENGKLIKTIANTRTTAGPLSTNFLSSKWGANNSMELKYTVTAVTVSGVETEASNVIRIYSPPYDC